VIGWFAAGLIARPLERIADAAGRLRRQEPGAAIPTVGGPHEVRELARSLQDLVISLMRKDVALAKLQDAAHHDPLT
ncbi:HAMP domain-containing protein, partial [Acinetobacter baumannii]